MADNRTTELLCKLLEERGVEYFTNDDERAYDEPARTTWDFILCGYEMTVTATEFVDVEGKTYLEMDFHHAFTPEQAIAATLGGGECKFVSSKGSDYPPVCSACGYELGIYDCEWFEDGTYGYDGNYCPNCGARVVE